MLMKKILSLVALVMMTVVTAWADDVQVTWAMGESTDAVVTPDGAGAGSFAVGSGVTAKGTKTLNDVVYSIFLTPNYRGDNKHDENVTNGKYVDFVFTPAGGEFTPTKFTLDVVKFGTGNPNIFVDVIDADGNVKTVGNNVVILRDNESGSPSRSFEISGVKGSSDAVTVRIIIGKNDANKSVGFANVVLEGEMISADAPQFNAGPASVTLKATPLLPAPKVTLSLVGKNLTDGSFSAAVNPAVEGLSLSPAEFVVENGVISQDIELSYAPTADAQGQTEIVFNVGGQTAKVAVTYAARLTPYEQTIVKEAKTWDWTTLTEIIQLTDESVPSKNDEFVFRELEDMINFGSFDAQSIVISKAQFPVRNKVFQDGTIKFKTNVAGTVAVDFSDTGSSGDGINRYLNVQGVNSEFYANREEIGADQVNATGVYVHPGEVAITGCDAEGALTPIRIYKVTFTPGELQGTDYCIVGELTGGWPTEDNVTDVKMTQSADNADIYTLVVRGFKAEAKTYVYKLRANYSWDNTYQLPATGNEHWTCNEAGTYDLTFTADVANHSLKIDAVRTDAPVVDPTDPYENVKITPADRSVVTSLKEFELDFSDLANAGRTVALGQLFDSPYLICNGNENSKVECAQVAFDAGKVILTFEEITDPGNYKLVIPTGLITVDNEPNIELSFYYTIPGMSDYSIYPEEGEYDELESFLITFNNYMVDSADGGTAYMLKSGSENQIPVSYFAIAGGTQVYVTLNDKVVAAGEYTLVLEGNCLTKIFDGRPVPAMSFHYTVTGINDQPVVEASPYYLVGNMTNWAVVEENNLTENTAAVTKEYMITLNLDADAQFKVVKKNGQEEPTWYPAGTGNAYGEHGELQGAGNYTVYFRPNADGGDDWFNHVIYVQKNDVDAISTVSTAQQRSVVYNMQGVRVNSTAVKGLYIVNGKKVVVK